VTRATVVAIVGALEAAGARYLIVGGLAVNAHGYYRLTLDVDIVLDMDEENVRRATRALAAIGWRPLAPVPIEQFAEAERRREWIRDKGLIVFTLHNAADLETKLDLFVESPFDFADAYRRAFRADIGAGVSAWFVGYDDLIALKRAAGRPRDFGDIDELEEVRRVREELERKGPDDPGLVEEDLWPRGWAGHRRAQIRHTAKISLADQLGWLEEAQQLSAQIARGRRIERR
jgi:hypothetical protein